MNELAVTDVKPLYSQITRNIIVMVQPEYMPQSSKPKESHYFWTYHVTIGNGGNETVRLIHRNWKIVDENGQLTEVSGTGVVGRQPILRPGEQFQYSSGTPLGAPSGMMYGSYVIRSGSGEEFSVEIPPFSLDSEHTVVRIVH